MEPNKPTLTDFSENYNQKKETSKLSLTEFSNNFNESPENPNDKVWEKLEPYKNLFGLDGYDPRTNEIFYKKGGTLRSQNFDTALGNFGLERKGNGFTFKKPETYSEQQQPSMKFNFSDDTVIIDGNKFNIGEEIDKLYAAGKNEEAKQLQRDYYDANLRDIERIKKEREDEWKASQKSSPYDAFKYMTGSTGAVGQLSARLDEKREMNNYINSDPNTRISLQNRERQGRYIDGQINEIGNEISALREKIKENPQSYENIPSEQRFSQAAGFSKRIPPTEDEIKLNNLEKAQNLLKQASKMNEASNTEEGLKSFWQGLTSGKFTDILPFVGGLIDILDAVEITGIAKRKSKGESISPEEESILNGYIALKAIQENSKMSYSYEIAKGMKDMIPFMVEMALTEGVASAVRKPVMGGLKKMIGETIEEGVKRTAPQKIASRAIEGGSYMLGTAAQTFTQPLLYKNLAESELGRYQFNDDGTINYISEKSITGQLWKDYVSAWQEIASEGFLSGVGKVVPPKGSVAKFMKKAGWSNLFKEWLEENLGDAMESILTLDGEHAMGMLDMRQQVILLGTVAGFGGGLHVVTKAQQAAHNNQINKQLNEVGNELDSDIRANIDNIINSFDKEKANGMISRITEIQDPVQRQNAIDYFVGKMSLKGQEIGNESAVKGVAGSFVNKQTETVQTAQYEEEDGYFILGRYSNRGVPMIRLSRGTEIINVPENLVQQTGEYDKTAFVNRILVSRIHENAIVRDEAKSWLKPYSHVRNIDGEDKNVFYMVKAPIEKEMIDVILVDPNDMTSPDGMVRVVNAAEIGENPTIHFVHAKDIVTEGGGGFILEDYVKGIADITDPIPQTSMQKEILNEPTMSDLNGEDYLDKEVIIKNESGDLTDMDGIVRGVFMGVSNKKGDFVKSNEPNAELVANIEIGEETINFAVKDLYIKENQADKSKDVTDKVAVEEQPVTKEQQDESERQAFNELIKSKTNKDGSVNERALTADMLIRYIQESGISDKHKDEKLQSEINKLVKNKNKTIAEIQKLEALQEYQLNIQEARLNELEKQREKHLGQITNDALAQTELFNQEDAVQTEETPILKQIANTAKEPETAVPTELTPVQRRLKRLFPQNFSVDDNNGLAEIKGTDKNGYSIRIKETTEGDYHVIISEHIVGADKIPRLESFFNKTLTGEQLGDIPKIIKDSTAPAKIKSEEEFINDKIDKYITENNLSREDFEESEEDSGYEIENNFTSQYPSYIKELADSGELQRMYDEGNVGDKIKIKKAIDAANFKFGDLIDDSKEKEAQKAKREAKKSTEDKEYQQWVAENIKFQIEEANKIEQVSQFIKDVLDGKAKGKTYIELPEVINRRAEQILGHPITSHKIGANEIRHAWHNHGVGGTKLNENSIPLRKGDFALMPYIMAAPDRITKGTPTTSGIESVRYYKNLSNGYVVVVEREGRYDIGEMENITMWAEKNQPPYDVYAPKNSASQTTSKTLVISPTDKNHSTNATSANQKGTSVVTSETGISQNDAAKIRKDFESTVFQQTKNKFTQISEKEFNALIEVLKRLGLSKEVTFYDGITDNKLGEFKNKREFRNPNGVIYGFATEDGRIFIDRARTNANTPIHEFAHLWIDFVEENHKELWDRGVALIKLSKYWEKVNNDHNYSHLDETAKIKEAISMAIGDKGEQVVNKKGLGKKLLDWINEVWDWIGSKLGIRGLNSEQIQNLSLQQFIDGAVADILSGEKIETNYDFDVKGITETNAKEMQQIKEKAVADGTFMKALNGKPTNLNERQWLQVRTKAFKKWFGDFENDPENASKVVDENGEPLIVAHSTNKSFYEFKNNQENDSGWLGSGYYFFGDRSLDGQYGSNVMEVFLNIREPYFATTQDFINLSKQDFIGNKGKEASRQFTEDLINDGYDGVYFNENLNQEWVAYDPTQIKSATANNGNFDEGSGDIRFQNIEKNVDERYFSAIERGDMDEAQKIIDSEARKNGYLSDNEYRMSHQAPSREEINFSDLMKDGTVPSDYWTRPRYYMYERTDWDSFRSVKSAIDAYNEKGKASIVMYRAVPKDVKDDSFRNGDWITPSLEYAKTEGEGIRGGYRIIRMRVNIKNVWWDANDINEFGYDDGKSYVYRNTKNNRKLNDVITKDDDGKIIPPSKRFNYRNSNIRFQTDKINLENSPENAKFQIEEKKPPKASEYRDENGKYDFKAYGEAKREYEAYIENKTGRPAYQDKELQKRIAEDFAGAFQNIGYKAPQKIIAQRFTEVMVDKYTRLKTLVGEFEKRSGKKISIEDNPYHHFDKISTRSQARIDDFRHEKLNPLLSVIKSMKDGVSGVNIESDSKFVNEFTNAAKSGNIMRTFDLYMMAKHAPYRNEWIQKKINDAKQTSENEIMQTDIFARDFTDKEKEDILKKKATGSGISDSDAKAVVGTFEKNFTREQVMNLWEKVEGVTDTHLKALLETGRITKEAYETVKKELPYFVPLRGWDISETDGKELDVLFTNYQEAKGRRSIADSPLANMAKIAEDAIMFKERNDAKREIIKMAEKYRYDDLIKVGEHELNKTSKEDAKKHEVGVWRDGKRYILDFSDEKIARELSSTSEKDKKEWYDHLFDVFGEITRFMASLMTQKNPAFMLRNPIRDAQTASAWLFVNYDLPMVGKFHAQLPKAIKTVAYMDFNSGKKPVTDTQIMYDEYRKSGARVGYTHVMTIARFKKDVKRAIHRKGNVDGKNFFKWAGSMFDTAAAVSEDSTRFAVFMAARKSGKSIEEASNMAKEASINFNRSGEWSAGFGKFFAFFNATVQSAHNQIGLFKTNWKKATAVAAVHTGLGYLIGWAGHALLSAILGWDDDEDNLKNLSDYRKYTNLILSTGNGGYAQIPLSQEWRPFYALGFAISQIQSGELTPKEAGFNVLEQFSNMSPVDISNGLWGLTPTPVEPVVEAFFKKSDFMGVPLVGYGNDLPNYMRGVRKNGNPMWTALAEVIARGDKNAMAKKYNNEETGKPEEIWLDASPDQIRQLVVGYFGGLGKFTDDLTALSYNLIKGIDVDVNNIPIASQYYSEPKPHYYTNKFYQLYSEFKEFDSNFDKDASSGRTEKYIELPQFKRYTREVIPIITSAINDINAAKEKDLKKEHNEWDGEKNVRISEEAKRGYKKDENEVRKEVESISKEAVLKIEPILKEIGWM